MNTWYESNRRLAGLLRAPADVENKRHALHTFDRALYV
jgi:hypothetical protein